MIEQYYYWLSTLARVFTQPISALADQINIPLVSALLFGLIGATAPSPNYLLALRSTLVDTAAGDGSRR